MARSKRVVARASSQPDHLQHSMSKVTTPGHQVDQRVVFPSLRVTDQTFVQNITKSEGRSLRSPLRRPRMSMRRAMAGGARSTNICSEASGAPPSLSVARQGASGHLPKPKSAAQIGFMGRIVFPRLRRPSFAFANLFLPIMLFAQFGAKMSSAAVAWRLYF